MADIYAKFRNNYSENRRWIIKDYGRDSGDPPVVFDGYLDTDAETDWIALSDKGDVSYQRPTDGAETHPMTVHDGDTVNMD
jgi:hypothetical protein